jgi:hypothetical protein
MAVINGTNRTANWTGSAPQINYLYPGDAEGRFTSGNVNFPNDINGYSLGDFVVRATGTITIPTTGTYTFGMTLDDGGRLRVNNTDVIVDETGIPHGMGDRFGQITLTAGTYPIEMVYMGIWGGRRRALRAKRQPHELEHRLQARRQYRQWRAGRQQF